MKRQTILLITTFVIGIFLGWVFFHSPQTKEEKHDFAPESVKETIWTCAMHPQIKMSKSGKCPICAMDLIQLNQGGATIDPEAIRMTNEAAQLANVLTSVVSKQNPVMEIRLYGKVQADERLLQSQVSYLPGRIEKLLVNFTGEAVRKGQTLAVIYSPDLVTAQQELLETVTTKYSQPAIYEASKEKLRQWKLTEDQIASIEKSEKVKTNFEILANTTGIISARRVNNGDYVSSGTVLFDVADLSHIWVMFDAYESDLPYLSQGQKVTFTIQALPGVNYSGIITFIDPVLDPVTRVAKVRVEINNQSGKLKPEMFVTGIVKATLNEYKDKLVIPRTAVLWTGKRSLVYVKQSEADEPVFKIREIEIGPLLGNSYVVMDGLSDGEEIVTQGTFSVDASAQLEGKPSMMNQNEIVSIKPNKTGDETDRIADQDHFSIQKINVSGKCEMCKERIESAAKSVEGTVSAEWDINKKTLLVKFDKIKTNSDAIQKAIAKTGHDTEKYKATDEVYNQLPECCLYRK